MARVRYNVMLSEDENTYANDEWSRLLPDIRHNATVDLDAVFGELQLINPRAKSFLSGIQAFYGIPAVLIAECKSRIDKGLMTDVLDEFDHVLGRSVDTYSDEVDETQASINIRNMLPEILIIQ